MAKLLDLHEKFLAEDFVSANYDAIKAENKCETFCNCLVILG